MEKLILASLIAGLLAIICVLIIGPMIGGGIFAITFYVIGAVLICVAACLLRAGARKSLINL